MSELVLRLRAMPSSLVVAREAADRIEALEAALQSIVQWSDTYPVGHVTDYAGKIARAALDKDAGK